MSARHRLGSSSWPSAARELLIEAGIHADERGLAAWQSWRSANRLEEIDWCSQQLLPLVYRAIAGRGADDRDLAVLKGVYRKAWTANQMRFREAADAVEALSAAGIPTMILKGVALAKLHYRDDGVRPMGDVDLLVPFDRAPEAIGVLAEHGWRSSIDNLAHTMDVRHGAPLRDSGARQLDLHWNLLWQPSDDSELWRRAVPLELFGAPTLALSPTDQLLHVLVHGTYWSNLAFRWVPDAATVMASAPIDWELFLAAARSHEVTWGLAAMLGYLAARMGSEVPDATLDQLRATPIPRYARRGQEARSRPSGLVRELRKNWYRYRRLARLRGQRPMPRGFATHLRMIRGDEHNWQLVARGSRRAVEHGLQRIRLRGARAQP
ncbi:MAG: hypothetical protein QOJ01_2405 [Solirubrobacterales bacterium]|jgi:hypothetical protein|nr:hypothetical protein [Solirubrobacterales bacterium]